MTAALTADAGELPAVFVAVTVGLDARSAETSRWNGRLNFAGAAGSQLLFRQARTMRRISPPVLLNTDAIVLI